jgi:hypothetical protein
MFSAGDTFEQALANTREAIELQLEGLLEEDLDIPRPSSIEQHLDNPDFAGGPRGFIGFAIVPYLGNKASRSKATTLVASHYCRHSDD